jgi:hypothetical protein
VTQSYYAEMGGIYVTVEPGRALPAATRLSLPLFEAEHFRLVKYEQLPTQEYIEDKSKADTFKRVVTTTQAAWALAQVFGRWAKHLPISNLELGTVAYVLCALATYIAWWHKPYDVSIITVLEQVSIQDYQNKVGPGYRHSISDNDNDHNNDPIDARRGSNDLHGGPDVTTGPDIVDHGVDRDFNDQLGRLGASFIFWASPDEAMIGHYTPSMTGQIWWSFFLAVVFCSFGGIHAAGWNFSFPTVAEMWLWRVCSLIQVVVPFFLFLCLAFKRIVSYWFPYPRGQWVQSTYDMILLPCGAIYLVARTIIVVLMFCTLRSSSPDIYKKLSWSSFVPHWG